MKAQTEHHNISISLTKNVQLEMRDLIFLRMMSKFCIDNRMPGYKACEDLNNLLRDMGIDESFVGPIYGVFELVKGK